MLMSNFNTLKLSIIPIYFSLFMGLTLNFLNNFILKKNDYMATLILFVMIFFVIYFFLLNVKKETIYLGKFSNKKLSIDIVGFSLFIMSEIMVFVSLFWSYIHNGYSPNQFMGNFWPPKGIEPSNPTSMIIFGTSILLSSSMIIMYCHNNLLNKNNKIKANMYLITTIFMGLIFMDMQVIEMSNLMLKLQFSFNDSIFSNSFLLTTSLHASHVFIGSIMLMLSFIALKDYANSMKLNLNMEMSIWYWHFVDYVWIGVFSIFYYLNV